jgi:N-acetyl-anhydromuramyl-L-alanine amidase AmpD
VNAPIAIADALSFARLRSTHPRRERCRAIVLHWTGGMGGPEQVYRTLRSRVGPRTPDGLSVHYVISAHGEVVQMAPTSLVCLHAGVANEWSVGVEIVSPGLPMGAAYEREKKAGVQRAVYADRMRKARRPIKLLDFTTAQTDAVTLLVESLCDTLGIVRAVPTEGDELMRRQMTAAELGAFSGVMGHFHAHPTKLDPGTALLERLRQRWA